MDFSTATLWWVAAGITVAAELATGTFYLLMIALGLAAAGIVAQLGLAAPVPLIAAALVGGGATALWHWRRASEPRSAPAHENPDVNLDIGAHVNVAAWSGDRTALVPYRGSVWQARLAPGAPALAGMHRVAAVEGNWLVLAPSGPPQ